MTAFFTEFSLASIGVRLVLAVVLGGLVGLERSKRRYAAGLRTFALVALGSALATLTAIYLGNISMGDADIGRIPAQILCGIGFLGAGTIIVTDRKQVKGLTTAAGLWVTSTIGIACGAGFIWPAVITLVLVLFTNQAMESLSRYLEEHAKGVDVYVEVRKDSIHSMVTGIRDMGYRVKSLERWREKPIIETDVALHLSLHMNENKEHEKVINEIRDLDGVDYAEEI